MPTAFAEIEDLARYLNREIVTTEDWAAADAALTIASDDIRALVKSDIVAVTTSGALLDGNPSGSATIILAPPYPVTAVASVEVLGTDNATWTPLVYQSDYAWTAEGILSRITTASDITNVPVVNWPARPQAVRVTYTHGLATVPGGIRNICLSRAARQFMNPTGAIQEIIDGYLVRHAPNTHGLTTFEANEERVLGNYREVSVA